MKNRYEFLFAGFMAVFTGTWGDLMGIVFGVYAVKVLIAAADTPFCYVGVAWVRRATGIDPRSVS